jgi:hypothetical protein
MQLPNFFEMRHHGRLEALSKHSDSTLMALAIPNDNGGLINVHIPPLRGRLRLDPQAECLHKSQLTAVKNLTHQCRGVLQLAENLAYLILARSSGGSIHGGTANLSSGFPHAAIPCNRRS